MTAPKKSSTSKSKTTGKKKPAPKATAPDKGADKAETEASAGSEQEQPLETEAPTPAPSGRTAEEWLSISKLHLGVKPWIVRAATAGHAPGRKYTEGEIRSLIRRKMSEPA